MLTFLSQLWWLWMNDKNVKCGLDFTLDRRRKTFRERSGRAAGGHRQGKGIPKSFLHAWLGRKHKVSLRSLPEDSIWMNLGGKSWPKKVIYACVYRIEIKHRLCFWHVKCIFILKILSFPYFILIKNTFNSIQWIWLLNWLPIAVCNEGLSFTVPRSPGPPTARPAVRSMALPHSASAFLPKIRHTTILLSQDSWAWGYTSASLGQSTLAR